MFMFKKKSTWERFTEPVTGAVSQASVKSGLATVATTAIGMTLASAAVSALRRRSAAG